MPAQLRYVIKNIVEIDGAIKENANRIEAINQDEINLQLTLKNAKEAETIATGKYSENPTVEHQEILEKAREFTTTSQRRVNLFKNGSGPFINDNKHLWARRKSLLNELSKLRSGNSREQLEAERAELLKALCPKVIRLMLLTSHLDGVNILQLDFNRMMQKHNPEFKRELESVKAELKETFESVYADQ